MNKSENIRMGRHYNLLSASAAFMIWGGWAYMVNREVNSLSGIVSGFTQGTASFIITLFMVHAVTWIFKRVNNRYFQLFMPATIVVSFTATFLATVHFLIHTPNILYTISPALCVAFLFCIFTSYKLQKKSVGSIANSVSYKRR